MYRNTINFKCYIGKCHGNVKKRQNAHIAGRGSQLLKRAFDKYGIENFTFEILHDGVLDELLDTYEIEAIAKYNAVAPHGYNLTYGGEGGIPSEETRQKRSKSLKGKPSHNKGKTLSEETRRRMSEAKKGYKVSQETRAKISKVHKGKTLSEEHRQKIIESNTGRKHSDETRRKISEGNKGKTHSIESRRKISEARKDKKQGPHSEEHRRKIGNAHKGKKYSKETRFKISEAMQSPDRTLARKFFFSLSSDLNLKEKRKCLRQKFPHKPCRTIYQWCKKFNSETPPKN